MNHWERLDAYYAANVDLHCHLTVGYMCMWTCELKLIDAQDRETPDHGYTVYATGAATAESALGRALDELQVVIDRLKSLPKAAEWMQERRAPVDIVGPRDPESIV